MANPFFANTIDLIDGTKARASQVESNFAAVEVGFDAVNVQMLLKGSIAGQVWTGTHDFTGTTITVPTPTLAAHPATKGYVDAAAFSSSLPGQGGNAGKVIYTNGTTASWAFTVDSINGQTGAITGVVTLTGNDTMFNKRISAYYYLDRTTVNAAATGALTLDVSTASVFELTLSGNVSGITIANAPTLSGETLSFVVRVKQPGTAYTFAWFTGITWLTAGGAAPPAPTANNTTEYIFTTTSTGAYLGRKGAAT
jgi:hypothetical protein